MASAAAIQLNGQCHCGALVVTFTPSIPIAQLAIRACQCGFCTRHGANTTTDPRGRLVIDVRDPTRLARYRFGLATADYLVCRECGVYIAAVMTAGAASLATLNINVLAAADRARFSSEVAPASYDGEDRAARIARRLARWTPTEIRGA